MKVQITTQTHSQIELSAQKTPSPKDQDGVQLAKIQTSKKSEGTFFSRAKSLIPFNRLSTPSKDNQPAFDEENPALREAKSPASAFVKGQEKCPANAIADQLTKKPPVSTKDGKVEYPKADPLRQASTAIAGTAALAIRRIKGPMSFCIVMSLFLASVNNNTSTKDIIRNLVRQQEKEINDKVANSKALEQFPSYIQGLRDEGNELFKEIATEELKREKCQAQLAMALHDELEGWEENYEALKNKTLSTLTEQDSILKEMTDNVDETLNENIVDLQEMKSEVKEGRAAIKDAKDALLAQYTIEYEKAQYNIEVADETLNEVQDKVEGAKNRMEKTRNNINKHKDRGPVRKKILGKAAEALNYVHDQLTSIGETQFDFQKLGTPDEYKEELDRQFQPTEDLLEGLEQTADLIIANNENGLITHDSLSQAHQQSSDGLRDFIEKQELRENLLKQTESIYKVYESKVNATQAYINGTESNKLDQNATLLAFETVKQEATDGVSNTFNKTLLSEKNEQRFDRFDKFKNRVFWALQGALALGTLYFTSATGRRTYDEMRGKPNSSLGAFGKKVLNERFEFHDDVGVRAGKSMFGKLTNTKVRGLRCESTCNVLKDVLLGKENIFFNAMFLLWIGTLLKDKYLAPAFNELDQKTQERISGIDQTLFEAQKAYHNDIKAACVESYNSKLTVSGLNGVLSDEIQSAYDTDPQIKEAVDFLRMHQQDPECQDPILNEGLKFQDMTAEELLESCEDLATKYVGDYFKENFNLDDYYQQLNESMEVLKEGESDYKAKRNFEHWAMGLLFGAVVFSEITIKSHKYKDPNEVERHNMGARNRGLFKNRENRPVPEALSRMNHLLNYLGLELDGKPLLPEIENFDHMGGYNPKKDPEYKGERVHWDSMKNKSSWLPWKKSLSKEDKKKIDQIKSQVASELEHSAGIRKEELAFILESDIIIVHDLGLFREATSKKGWLENLTDGFKEKISLRGMEAESTVRESEDDDVSVVHSVATHRGDVEMALFNSR